MRKLTNEAWEEIRIELQKPDVNVTLLAKQYNISRHSIYMYANRRNWLKKKNVGFLERLWLKICLKRKQNLAWKDEWRTING